MNFIKGVKENVSQILAVAEKNVKLGSRHKLALILTFVSPIIGVIMPLIVMGEILNFAEADNFGPWNSRNMAIYQFTAYMSVMLYNIINSIQRGISQEKGGNTITLLILAPFRRFNLLLGIFFSHFVFIAVPFVTFFIICFIFNPVSIITLIFIIFADLLIATFFSGIGLVLAVFIISKQHLVALFNIPLGILVMFSALTLPFEFFPGYYQNIANLNPFYYIFSIVKFIWVEDNIIISITSHPETFLVVVSLAIISPLLGLKFFNYIFDKYGITIY